MAYVFTHGYSSASVPPATHISIFSNLPKLSVSLNDALYSRRYYLKCFEMENFKQFLQL